MSQKKPLFVLRPPPLLLAFNICVFIGLFLFATYTWKDSVIGTLLLMIFLFFVWSPMFITIKILLCDDRFQIVSSYAILPNIRKLTRIECQYSTIKSILVERTTPFIPEGSNIKHITWRDRVIIPGVVALPGLYFHKLEKLIEYAQLANPNIVITSSRTTVQSNLSEMT